MSVYRAYGLAWESPIVFPASPVCDDAPDVVVQAGAISLLDPLNCEQPYAREIDGDRLAMSWAGLFAVELEAGQRITVWTHPDCEPYTASNLLSGAAAAVVLMQRGELVLHAGAVAGAQGAVVICGDQGSGKSTMVSALARSGLPFVCDDVARITVNDGVPVCARGPARTKLWPDSCAVLGVDPTTLPLVHQGHDKRSLDLEATDAEWTPVRALVLVDPDITEPSEGVSAARLPQLIRAGHAPHLLEHFDQARHFTTVTQLADAARILVVPPIRDAAAAARVEQFVREAVG